MAEPTGKPGKGGTGTRSGSEEDDGDVKKSGKEDDWTRTRKDNHVSVSGFEVFFCLVFRGGCVGVVRGDGEGVELTSATHTPPPLFFDSQKEVERRRRETINDGINDLKKIVPGCEKNKGSILQRAVQYIQQLKEAEASNIEKWTLEKLLTDQSVRLFLPFPSFLAPPPPPSWGCFT